MEVEKISFTDRIHTHVHGFGHLIFPLQGFQFLQTKSQEVILDEQHMLLLLPDCEHTYFAKEHNESLVFHIPWFMFPDKSDSTGIIYMALDERWKALRLLLLYESQEKELNASSINSLFYYSLNLTKKKEELPSVQYIHKHFNTNISIELLARLEYYNASYYSQWFQNKMGVNLQTYIQSLRLNEAKRLLRETNFSILNH